MLYNKNGHPGRGVPATETPPREGCPYGRNGHLGRGAPTVKTDTPGGVSLRGRDSVELPKRNPNRIRGFDYSQNGAYFVTICTQNRQRIFSKQAENFFKDRRDTRPRVSASTMPGIIVLWKNRRQIHPADEYIL